MSGVVKTYIGYCSKFKRPSDPPAFFFGGYVMHDVHCATCVHKPVEPPPDVETAIEYKPGCKYGIVEEQKTADGKTKVVVERDVILCRTEVFRVGGGSEKQARYFCPHCGYERSEKIFKSANFKGALCPDCHEIVSRPRVYRPWTLRHRIAKRLGMAWEPDKK